MEGLLRVSTYIIPVQTSLPPSFKLSQMEPEFVKKQSVSKSEKINRHPRITSTTSKGWFRRNIWAPYRAYKQIFTWRLWTGWMYIRLEVKVIHLTIDPYLFCLYSPRSLKEGYTKWFMTIYSSTTCCLHHSLTFAFSTALQPTWPM